MQDEITARRLFETFDKKYKLEIYYQEIAKYKYSDDDKIQLDFIMEKPH